MQTKSQNPMSKLLETLLKVSHSYFEKHPVPQSVRAFGNSLLISSKVVTPLTNSRKTIDSLYHLQPINQSNTHINSSAYSLKYVQKPNRIEIDNSYHNFLVGDKHETLLQDDIFGYARHNKNRTKWVYVAKLKQDKVTSYFENGKGNNQYMSDFGETYTGTAKNAIFVLDVDKSTIIKIPNEDNSIVSSPCFSDDQGHSIIYHSFKREHFGYGILHCFNRNTQLYEATLKEGDTFELKRLESPYQTNMFARVSKCKQYLIYFCGQGVTHTYYMHIRIMKKHQNTWQQFHQLDHFYVGYYNNCRMEIFEKQGKPFAIVQTMHEGSISLFEIDIQAKTHRDYSKNQLGESCSILHFNPFSNLLVVSYCSINKTYLKYAYLPGDLIEIPSQNSIEDFTIQKNHKPIPYYLLKSSKTNELLEAVVKKSDKKPLAVLIHGGPHGTGDLSLTFLKYLLLQAGYTIFIPNFSGSISYGKGFLENALGKIGQVDAQEIVACVEDLLKTGEYDPKRVYLYGGSYGGYMSGILGGRYPQYFAAAVMLNPVLNIPFMVSSTDIPEWCTIESLNKSSFVDLTGDDYAKMYNDSPMSTPNKIPTMLILGQKDRRVPFESARMYQALLKSKGVPVKTYIYPQSNHSLSDSVETGIDIVMKSFLFFEENSKQ